MAHDEPDHAKRAKLDALQLSVDEWNHVKLFPDLLRVRATFGLHTCGLFTHNFSMLTEHNRHSHPMKAHPFIRASQH
jgi:hypothetical protein